MDKVVTVTEMRAIEREADASGLDYSQMMENAGWGLAEEIDNAYSHSSNKSIFAIVGSGNNGGDALVALSLLAKRGWDTCAYIVTSRPKGDLLVDRLIRNSGKIFFCDSDQGYEILKYELSQCLVILDGVLGTGVRLPLKGPVADCLLIVKQYREEQRGILHVVAVDCPSGVDCDCGQVAEETIPADLTVTMAAAKQGLLYPPAVNYLGKLHVVEIGNIAHLDSWKNVKRLIVDSNWVKHKLPARLRGSHKGTFGTAMIVAGSSHYLGAALLSGRAAGRAGAGLVQMAVPSAIQPPLAGHMPEAVWLPLPHIEGHLCFDSVKFILTNPSRVTAILVGPGLSLHPDTYEFIQELFKINALAYVLPPLVLDADGLKIVKSIPDWESKLPHNSILTPHPGEMAILTGLDIGQIQSDRIRITENYAKLWGHVVVLKGAYTVVASPEDKTAIIPIATSALAKAGTGDVLAGIIVGLLAQGVKPFDAAFMGAWIHAEAGLSAENRFGSVSTLAGDLVDIIGDVFIRLN